MLDVGFSVQAELRTDSTAAKELALRRGAGQVRHPLPSPVVATSSRTRGISNRETS